MLYAMCDRCGKPVEDVVTPDGIQIEVEPPKTVDDQDEEEFEIGGKLLVIKVIDVTGDVLDEHFCRDCLVYEIAAAPKPTDEDGDEGGDGGEGDEEPTPVEPAGQKQGE